jgi:hypothetical protein
MGSITDYLDWRGDLTFAQSPFNEVDNAILSQLSYVNFDRIVPPKGSGDEISLADAAARYFHRIDEERIRSYGIILRSSVELLRKVAGTARFADVGMSCFQNVIDPDETKQFSAMHFRLSDGTAYIAYRGTDDTLIGWKENFNMSFRTPVPAQLEAVRYLNDTAKDGTLTIRLGGHSKGGNLAVYAAAMCDPDIKARIVEVYNNDGPGFDSTFLQSEAYREVRGKIRTIVPQLSIVGMLLEHEEPQIVVKSNRSLWFQHLIMTWEVMGNRFVRAEQVRKESRLIEAAVKSWLEQLHVEERKQFVDNVFMIFEEAHLRTVDDLTRAKWRTVAQLIKALNQSPEHKAVLTRALRILFREGRNAFWDERRNPNT